jgi:CHAT domain-containing protein
LPSNIAELTIIPSGKLGTLPFETLVSKKLKSPDFKSAEYLIKKCAIGYEFSIGLLLGKKDVEKTSDPSIYLCAPIQFPSNQNLAELPGTEEVKTIAGLFGNRSTVHLFDEANESMIKSNLLSGFQYLHFATHGIVDQVNPASSQLFLNASQQEDGNLYAGEIYNLTLNSNLAVLSACQTGLGKFSKGEGVIGLSRALVYAGAKNLIVSFWSVADESTAQLMTDFYTNLLRAKDQNFKQALRQSKLKMISDKNYGAPYFWAPFILIGK